MTTTQVSTPAGAPLAPDQIDHLNKLMAGLQPDQLMWLEGFISGLRAAGGSPAGQAPSPAAAPELTVLYGTESGNSEGLADEAVKSAKTHGFKAKAVNMADFSVKKLAGVQTCWSS